MSLTTYVNRTRGQGMQELVANPQYWGPLFWEMLYIAAAGYSQTPTANEKIGFQLFFDSLRYVLPCAQCRGEYDRYITANPLTGEDTLSRDALFSWVYYLHESVSMRLLKPPLVSLEAMQQAYFPPLVATNQLIPSQGYRSFTAGRAVVSHNAPLRLGSASGAGSAIATRPVAPRRLTMVARGRPATPTQITQAAPPRPATPSAPRTVASPRVVAPPRTVASPRAVALPRIVAPPPVRAVSVARPVSRAFTPRKPTGLLTAMNALRAVHVTPAPSAQRQLLYAPPAAGTARKPGCGCKGR